jgi:hypothetical protein
MSDKDILTHLNRIDTNPFSSTGQQIGYDAQKLRTALKSRISIQRNRSLMLPSTQKTTQNLNTLNREIEHGIRNLKRHGFDFSLPPKVSSCNRAAKPSTEVKDNVPPPQEATFTRTLARRPRPKLSRNTTVPQRPLGQEHENITPRS